MINQRREQVKKYFKNIIEGEPIVVMTFDPPQAGVFNSEQALDKALNKKSIQKAYTVLNELKEEVYDRLALNELAPTKKGQGISAKDISYYRFFLVDLDVVGLQVGGAKRNATDDEHAKALKVAESVEKFLTTMNFPKPILIDSGNGYHLLYKVHMKASQENERMLKNCLIAIGEQVDTNTVKVDTVVYDRGRKLKLPGSTNNAEEVGYRTSEIVKCPPNFTEVDIAVFQ